MYSPRPPAPMAAAMVADPTPTTAATRTPATIDGSASGSSTWRSSSPSVIPIATPPSRKKPANPHRAARLADRRVDPAQPGNRGADDRQQAVEDQDHERRPRADTADERHRQQ